MLLYCADLYCCTEAMAPPSDSPPPDQIRNLHLYQVLMTMFCKRLGLNSFATKETSVEIQLSAGTQSFTSQSLHWQRFGQMARDSRRRPLNTCVQFRMVGMLSAAAEDQRQRVHHMVPLVPAQKYLRCPQRNIEANTIHSEMLHKYIRYLSVCSDNVLAVCRYPVVIL